MTKQFDPTRPVQTRDGRKARIICMDRDDPSYPIVALCRVGGVEYLNSISRDGMRFAGGLPDSGDLINIPEKRECWINLYEGDGHTLDTEHFLTEESANETARKREPRGIFRISCIHHVWEE